MKYQMKIIILLMMIYLNVSFTPRTRCSSNKLTFTKRFTGFYLNAQQDLTLQPYITDFNYVLGYLIYHHGYSTVSGSVCSNFNPSGSSCCQDTDIIKMINYLQQFYTTLYQIAKYPSVQYLYDLRVNSTCRNILPSLTTNNTISYIISKHDTLINKITNIELQYIRDSVCIFCVGTKDYPNFINPKPSAAIKQLYYEWVINQSYFNQTTNSIASILLQLYAIHQQLTSAVLSLGNTLNCTDRSKFTDSTYWNSLNICNSWVSCRLFAMSYLGDVGGPQIMRQMLIEGQGGKLGYRSVINLSASGGYQGNISYPPLGDRLRDIAAFDNYTSLLQYLS